MQPNYYGNNYNNYPYNNQNYGYQQNQMNTPRPNNILFSLVNGIEEVRVFVVSPNQIAYLLDNNSSHLFIKKADIQGRYVIEDYILTKAEQENTEYVKASDFALLQQQIANLTNVVNNLSLNSQQTQKGE